MTKFLYILVSGQTDIYCEQTYVSMLSLKHYNPDAEISLLVDDETDKNLIGFRGEVKNLANEYKVVPFEKEISPMRRSRLLKTNMRNLIDGDFLYLDGDTVVAETLKIPNENWGDVAAVCDLHAREKDCYRTRNKRFINSLAKLKFTMSLDDLYFNSGVIFAKDSPKAKAFFDKWHELYQYCNQHEIFTGQFSFNETNHLFHFPIFEIPGEWNCQVREAYNHLYRVPRIYPLLCRVKILHFFGSGIQGKVEPHPLMDSEFYKNIKKKQAITEDDLNLIFHAKHAFYAAPEEFDPTKKFPSFFWKGKLRSQFVKKKNEKI